MSVVAPESSGVSSLMLPTTRLRSAAHHRTQVTGLRERDPGQLIPVQTTTSSIQIGPCTIAYDDRILAPRPWTLLQSEWAAEVARELADGPILELCSGAGHIGLVAAAQSGRNLIQVDADSTACDFARRNAIHAGLAGQVEIRHATLDDAARPGERFNLVLADPPYLPTGEVDRWPEDPTTAIDGGTDGLDLARQCLEIAAAALAPGGLMLLQLRGREQVNRLAREFRDDLDLVEIREFDAERAVAAWARSADRVTHPVQIASDALLVDRLDRALDRAASGDHSALDELSTARPAHEHDALSTLLLIHDLWLAPAEVLGDRVRSQSRPSVAALKWSLEADFAERLTARVEESSTSIDPDAAATIRRIANVDLVPRIYEWVRDAASWPALVEYLAWEGGPDAGFDDYVALAQVGIRGGPKVALARNYWDELGRGRLDEVHTVLHDRLVDATAMPRIPRPGLPVPALERLAIGGMLATDRARQAEALGAFGLLELQAGPRCRSVVRALRRLDAPAGAYPFYEEHAQADPHHGRAWLAEVIAPLARAHPGWGERMIMGARWRSEVNRRFFADAERHFVEPRLVVTGDRTLTRMGDATGQHVV